MLPAHERLAPCELTAAQPDNRLVPKLQLAMVDRTPQLQAESELAPLRRVLGGGVEGELVVGRPGCAHLGLRRPLPCGLGPCLGRYLVRLRQSVLPSVRLRRLGLLCGELCSAEQRCSVPAAFARQGQSGAYVEAHVKVEP